MGTEAAQQKRNLGIDFPVGGELGMLCVRNVFGVHERVYVAWVPSALGKKKRLAVRKVARSGLEASMTHGMNAA
eukprot:1144156-Pyramimonas_sp.AAC.1